MGDSDDPLPRSVVERYVEAYHSREIEAVMDLFAETVEAGGEEIVRDRIRDAIESWWAAFSDIEMAVDTVVADDEHAAMIFRFTGTNDGEFQGVEPTGRSVDVPECILFGTSDGRITQFDAVWDRLTFYDQLGLVEPPDT